ncbi:hypothetical protein ALP86_03133 [Pseudomonas amygdali pv. mori]|uniref:Uncharacterized protein n=1 Tax=Pseudomonas amygdali pv. mori TaxID=34065 RepID=A0A3M4VBV4_PSEA0|nr:hypothetical protein ALP86_03133 [Pseudomonas amygdali pv. mori]RMT22878.1 hypothetical protein ALP52_02461 [Pseudomonas amygdali pv. mori]
MDNWCGDMQHRLLRASVVRWLLVDVAKPAPGHGVQMCSPPTKAAEYLISSSYADSVEAMLNRAVSDAALVLDYIG